MDAPASSGGAAAIPGPWVRVCRYDTVGDRTIVPVIVEGRQLLLVRDGIQFHATERSCPHEGADLAKGRCADGKLFCPRHLAWFDLADGQVRGGWDFRPLRTYRIQLVDGEIYVDPTHAIGD